MDFDAAWCPACDRQIQPKRYLVSVPLTTTTIPPHRKGGLVSGTGRLRALKAQQQAQAAAAAATKQRLVIDNGPIPLYCSDACHLADINQRATDETRQQKSASKPKKSSKASTISSSASSSSSSSLSTPPKPLSSMEKFASAYNFSIPPPPPTFEEPVSPASHQYTNGIMMAGKLISELCPTKPAASNSSAKRYPASPPEPAKVTPGWNDGTGSSAWRSAVYNYTSTPSQQPVLGRTQSAETPRVRTRASSSGPSSAPSHPSPLESSELIAQFNNKFTKRCEARLGTTSSSSTPTPTSTSPTRERSLVASSAQGKLLVPDVKLKVRTGSSSSLSSMRSRTPLSAPATTTSTATGTTSRKSVRSPLSATHSHSDEERYSTSFTLRRPTIETRSWSYDNVPTYPIMQLPPTNITRVERHGIDGVEHDVEVEVEVKEERKRLFLFAPTRVCRV